MPNGLGSRDSMGRPFQFKGDQGARFALGHGMLVAKKPSIKPKPHPGGF